MSNTIEFLVNNGISDSQTVSFEQTMLTCGAKKYLPIHSVKHSINLNENNLKNLSNIAPITRCMLIAGVVLHPDFCVLFAIPDYPVIKAASELAALEWVILVLSRTEPSVHVSLELVMKRTGKPFLQCYSNFKATNLLS